MSDIWGDYGTIKAEHVSETGGAGSSVSLSLDFRDASRLAELSDAFTTKHS